MQKSPERLLLLVTVEVLLLLFIWFEWNLLLLTFAGLLAAILLNTLARWVERHTHLSSVLSFVVTVAALAAIFTGVVWLLGPSTVTQISEVFQALPQSLDQARAFLEQRPWGITLVGILHRIMSSPELSTKLAAFGKTVIESGADFILVMVIGFFAALSPYSNIRGVLLLIPAEYRGRTPEVLSEVVETLRWWLLGQLVPMGALGIASMIALWALGVPLAFTLGLLTGVLTFVPYVGSFISGIVAVLLAFQRGPDTALYTLIVYTLLHFSEGYVLTPLVQKKAVRLPPILTILSQFFFWSFGGLLGVAVATPMTAAGMVLVKTVYLKRQVKS